MARRATAAVSIVAVGLAVPQIVHSSNVSDQDAREIVGDLLRNVYQAFDYREEERIYDVLAHSVSGDLLTEIYLETQRSLEIENQGGARAKVKEGMSGSPAPISAIRGSSSPSLPWARRTM